MASWLSAAEVSGYILFENTPQLRKQYQGFHHLLAFCPANCQTLTAPFEDTSRLWWISQIRWYWIG
jgi:hypothetical protein